MSQPKFRIRFAETKEDVLRAQWLRYQTFVSRNQARIESNGLDQDKFDEECLHVLIEDLRTGELVCCFRILPLQDGKEIGRTYSAQIYELSKLSLYERPMVEMGRFCIKRGARDPAIIRMAWSAMAQFVEQHDVGMLFGCSSFDGLEAEAYMDAFALLRERYIAPKKWLPKIKAPNVFRFGASLINKRPNMKLAKKRMPPLLKSYLLLGGKVSDHAVVDKDLSTLHVFTGVEISDVPQVRARTLRANAGLVTDRPS